MSHMKNSMLRVNHAGEAGAVAIYKGQLAVLAGTPAAATIQKMLEQEYHHLETFNQLLPHYRVRPSALDPLWKAGGFTMGVVSALLGPKAAMACTAAVEEVIVQHYQAQEHTLSLDDPLRHTIEQFRQDEDHHRAEALDFGAGEMTGFEPFTHLIQTITRTAIAIAKIL